MTALYNEIEPYAAQWLRNLVAAGHIAEGTVDERSIVDLQPEDVAGDGQRHFFAGIGAWSYAIRLAGWPDDVPVWTGSCPCQPFSSAGKRRGFDDERHLWPEWFRLIRKCRPAVVFGEQVASPDGLVWLDTVRADLEAEGYAFGAADLCAAGVGAPHIRQRVYFVAYACGDKRVPWRTGQPHGGQVESSGRGNASGLGDACSKRAGRDPSAGVGQEAEGPRCWSSDRSVRHRSVTPGPVGGAWHGADWVSCVDGTSRPVEPGVPPLAHGATSRVGRLRAYGNAIVPQVAATFVRAVMESL